MSEEAQAFSRARGETTAADLPWFAGQLAALGLEALPSVGNFVLVRFPAGARGAAAATAAASSARTRDGRPAAMKRSIHGARRGM